MHIVDAETHGCSIRLCNTGTSQNHQHHLPRPDARRNEPLTHCPTLAEPQCLNTPADASPASSCPPTSLLRLSMPRWMFRNLLDDPPLHPPPIARPVAASPLPHAPPRTSFGHVDPGGPVATCRSSLGGVRAPCHHSGTMHPAARPVRLSALARRATCRVTQREGSAPPPSRAREAAGSTVKRRPRVPSAWFRRAEVPSEGAARPACCATPSSGAHPTRLARLATTRRRAAALPLATRSAGH